MRLNQLILGILLLTMLTSSCNGKKGNEPLSTENQSTSTGSVKTESLPYLSSKDVNSLYSIAEQVDIIFYKLPISVSQDDAASAKNTVLYISPAAPKITSECGPIGRLSWISDGKIVREADFYIGEGCNHFVFIENGKPVYKNAMGIEGVQYFQTIMSQVPPPDKK